MQCEATDIRRLVDFVLSPQHYLYPPSSMVFEVVPLHIRHALSLLVVGKSLQRAAFGSGQQLIEAPETESCCAIKEA